MEGTRPAKEPIGLPPSKVFGQRLRETREARNLKQAEVAKMMTDAGRPLSRAALLRIENGTRGLSLDEAVALALVLRANPSHMLTPPGDSMLALTDREGVDGPALRNWLTTGNPILAWPASPRDEDRDTLAELLLRTVTYHAVALIDAERIGDKDGIVVAARAIKEAIDKHRAALAAIRKEDP